MFLLWPCASKDFNVGGNTDTISLHVQFQVFEYKESTCSFLSLSSDFLLDTWRIPIWYTLNHRHMDSSSGAANIGR